MRDLLRTRWTEIGDKLVALAEDLPAEQYEARPAPGARSFAEQIRHVAFWNDYALRTLRGESPDGTANELSRSRYATKTAIVDALRASVRDVAAELTRRPAVLDDATADTVVSFIEHGAEHYGQLVMHYRVAGLVPPASRETAAV